MSAARFVVRLHKPRAFRLPGPRCGVAFGFGRATLPLFSFHLSDRKLTALLRARFDDFRGDGRDHEGQSKERR
jgi:hypothetical protein